MSHIVLFDGDCNICDTSVQFIIKRDPQQKFAFASLQSDTGKALLKKYQVDRRTDSIVLIEKSGKIFEKSSAALRIARRLKGGWKLTALFLIVPPFIRNFFYDLIAKNRYKWFGKKSSCRMPTPDERKRFLD
ncbi:thiol-disulfide oxidoreductase DCC family protein [Salipaludibacillus aurantiacus]|uniref:Predicted thiol-disulfide oxidoreductase YuxK, DCC family n=1 Tax=Salipaludibacillus aurantiacus TaxID=1601833 RepID=A0A1H9VSS7_9BACI|nr:thiol-disulfide oxidoreductase DCC family protein [Salipaludibacillus aurantiacus]SES24333.1 Predicted thiol-disulfide oxidoreductase YuxK, DCC family [Salipaludibacillus aurantiacus]